MLDVKWKFSLLRKLILSKDLLHEFLQKIPEKYTLYDLIQKGILAVIKKDERYLNLASPEKYTPRILGATYCKGTRYVFWWLAIYNLYGFTTQVAQNYMIYSDTFYGERQIYYTTIYFKKVKPDLIYGTNRRRYRGIQYLIMSKERAFIEFCKENEEKLVDLRRIYKTLNAKQLHLLLKKYPYQKTKNFIQKEIIECKV